MAACGDGNNTMTAAIQIKTKTIKIEKASDIRFMQFPPEAKEN